MEGRNKLRPRNKNNHITLSVEQSEIEKLPYLL